MGVREWLGLSRKKPPELAGARCSFCGRSAKEVKKLIGGPPPLFICDACVAKHSDLAEREEASIATFPRDCSFCGTTRRKVRAIVGDEKVSICNDCLGLCRDILAEEAHRA